MGPANMTAGPQGLQGEKGDTGATGATGPQGDTGATGATGAAGPMGPANMTAGPQGPQGLQGDAGPQGPKGDTGATGDQGIQGVPGPNQVTTSTTTTLTGIFCGNGATVNICSVLTLADSLLSADQHIAVNRSQIAYDYNQRILENQSLQVAGGPTSNTSAIAVFPSGAAGRAINSTNVTITGNGVNGPNVMDMGLGQIKDLADPTASQDVATKKYVDTGYAQVQQSANAYTDSYSSQWLSATNTKFAFANTTELLSGTGQTFTLNSTSPTRLVQFEIMGGGGGGGGAKGAANNLGLGGGGGAGGYCRVTVPAPLAFRAVTFTVGVNGTAGLQTPTAGGNGAGSSVTYNGVTYTANGGSGGATLASGTTAASFAAGGAGAAVSTGCDINGAGAPGGFALRTSGTVGISGFGAGTAWGGAGNSLTAAAAGNAGFGYGSGGGGGWSGSTTGQKGGMGGMGVVIITEYAA